VHPGDDDRPVEEPVVDPEPSVVPDEERPVGPDPDDDDPVVPDEEPPVDLTDHADHAADDDTDAGVSVSPGDA
jgi:hypothetical protein